MKSIPAPDPNPVKPKYVPPLVDFFASVCDDEGIRSRILIDNPTRLYWADEVRR
jgi:hypothetical protein